MAIPSLLGSYIDETYQRLVQVSGSEFADGLGNPITFGGGGSGSNANAFFISQSTWVFNHNLGNRFVIVEIFDASYNQIIPKELTLTDSNTATITFPTIESGYAVASLGGAGGSGSANIDTSSFVTTSSFNSFTSSYNTGSFTGSFTGDGSGLINLNIPTQVAGNQYEIQYNTGGNFGGVPVLTYDGITLQATGIFSGSFDDGIKKLILTGVSQSSTLDPTYNTVVNTLGDTFAFKRRNLGEYEIQLDNLSLFTSGYTYVMFTPGFPAWSSNTYTSYYEWISDSKIKFWIVKVGSGGTDDVLTNATIEIRVYPSP
jgi:hypothetical protein